MWEALGTWLGKKLGDRLMSTVETAVAKRLNEKPPTETVRVFPAPFKVPRWRYGDEEGEIYYVLIGEWVATNITGRDVTLISARLDDPPGVSNVRRRLQASKDFSEGPLLPHEPARIEVWFWIVAPDTTKRDAFEVTVTFTDQYGNEIARREIFKHEDDDPWTEKS